MVFKKRADNGGEVDPNINMEGKIKSNKSMSRRAIKERELLSLMRKIKPHLADAVNTSVKVMKNDESNDNNKLKSAALIMSFYRELLKDAYAGSDEDGDGTEVQPNNGPSFSLTMISDNKPNNSV
jgi:hypothetical protein